MPKKKPTETPAIEPESGVRVEPPTETVAAEPGDKAAEPVSEAEVKGGELAAAIADLAKVVDGKEEVIKPEVTATMIEPEQANRSELPAEQQKSKGRNGGLWVVVAFVLGLAMGLVIGYLVWGNGSLPSEIVNEKEMIEEVKPESVTPAPETTPMVEEVDRGGLKVLVLNGSGGKGIAATGKDYLETLGYKNVAVGNAENEDFAKTEIAVKSDGEGVFAALKADLEAKYSMNEEIKELDEDSEYDAVVTIGAE